MTTQKKEASDFWIIWIDRVQSFMHFTLTKFGVSQEDVKIFFDVWSKRNKDKLENN